MNLLPDHDEPRDSRPSTDTCPADAERSWEDDFERMVGHRYPCFGADTCAACLQVTNSNLENELERLRQREAALMRQVQQLHDEKEPAAQPTQQDVRQAMGAAYAREDPRSPRKRAVHVPLINGA